MVRPPLEPSAGGSEVRRLAALAKQGTRTGLLSKLSAGESLESAVVAVADLTALRALHRGAWIVVVIEL